MVNIAIALEDCLADYTTAHPEYFIGGIPYPIYWLKANIKKYFPGKTSKGNLEMIKLVINTLKEDWVTANSKWNRLLGDFSPTYLEEKAKLGSDICLIVKSNTVVIDSYTMSKGSSKWLFDGQAIVFRLEKGISKSKINVFIEDHEQQLQLLAAGLEWYTDGRVINPNDFTKDELLPSVQEAFQKILKNL